MIKLSGSDLYSKVRQAFCLFLLFLLASNTLIAQDNGELILSASEVGKTKLKEYSLNEPLYATWRIDKKVLEGIRSIDSKRLFLTIYAPEAKGDRKELIIYKLPQRIEANKRYTQPIFVPGNSKSVMAMMMKKSKRKLAPGTYKMRFDIFIESYSIAKAYLLVKIDNQGKRKILAMRGIPRAARDKEYRKYRQNKLLIIGSSTVITALGLVPGLQSFLYVGPAGLIYGATKPRLKGPSTAERYRIDGRASLDSRLKRQAEERANTLKGKMITKLTILTERKAVMPAGYTPFSVTATLADGRKLVTRGFGKGKTEWSDYKIELRGGYIDKDHDIVAIKNGLELQKQRHTIYVRVTSVHQPNITETLEIPVDFKSPSYHFRGNGGYNGRSGSAFAKNGQRGMDGSNGQNGQRGPTVEVYVEVVYDEVTKQKLRLHKIKSTNRSAPYIAFTGLTDSIYVHASGGHGGNGGDGGRGGNTDACNGIIQPGSGGNGGNGGNGGDGGAFIVYMTKEASKYKDYLVLRNTRGQGGYGGSRGRIGSIYYPGNSNCLRPSQGNASDGQNGQGGYHGNDGGFPRYEVKDFKIENK